MKKPSNKLAGAPKSVPSKSNAVKSTPKTGDSKPKTGNSGLKTGDSAPKSGDSAPKSGDSRAKTGDSKPQLPPPALIETPSARFDLQRPRLGFPVVGIGASAGGLEALEELLSNMPTDTGMAFVVVTHQHPSHTSLLPELLGKTTEIPVSEATDGLKLRPNHVYVGPPGGHLAILGGVLQRMETGTEEAPRLPIDYFFRSLAEDQKDKAICIVLSGTGTDGTLGLKAIKGESGMAMVQQLQSAKYSGMPSSAVATGLADYVLPPGAMPKQLVAYAQGPYLAAASPTDLEAQSLLLEPLQKIFLLLRSRTGHDFSAYKTSTIRRRIERRMNLHQIKTPKHYVRYLQENVHEIDILFKELLISVTSFFRDQEAFNSLAQNALTRLLKERPDGYSLRAWVPGCSTGEEAYSLAILLRECMKTLNRDQEFQIFGTDLDRDAIELSRGGRYPDGIAVDVSRERLERFFTREDGAYRICKEIRETAVFAVQNVIKDPPFTKLDLISCRNLLIYLNLDLQKRLLPLFHYALKPGGIMMLGPSETVGAFTDLFEPLDKKWKIFRRKESPLAQHPVLDFPRDLGRVELGTRTPAVARPAKEAGLTTIVERLLLTRFAPPSAVVNDRGDILFIHGRTGAFLEPAPGQPRLNILNMAREGLQLELAAALRRAAAGSEDVVREGLRVKSNGNSVLVDLTVTRIREPETVRGLLLVTFRQQPLVVEPAKPKSRVRKDGEGTRVAGLERELQCTKESLQTTIEELETSNEELKSTNEELQSTNEELQSTNEELETSKEEMQSLNEELTTVNTELQSKVEELSHTNDDMQNLLNSIDIATVFLDNDLRIKRYTDQTRRLFNLIQADVGRPLSDLVSSLSSGNLLHDCKEVLRTLVFKQEEVRTKDGRWFLMRIMPYRTAENVIDGLVLTFVDMNPIRDTQRSLRRMSKVFSEALDPMIILDSAGHILDLNEEAVRVYGWPRAELLGQSVMLTVPRAHQQALEEQFKQCLQGESVRNVECVRVDRAGREFKGLMSLALLTNEKDEPDSLVMMAKHTGAWT